jgi:uncharacterized protein YndB with AHSA1/START domain
VKSPTVVHATFVIERTYPASPARVFRAWADPAAKDAWNACHDDWKPEPRELDFRVGGRERQRTGAPGGTVHRYEAVYNDIVPDRLIVFTYEMYLDDVRISVSLTTVELEPDGTGTRLVFTEQGAFLDGLANAAEREEGTRLGFERLDVELGR